MKYVFLFHGGGPLDGNGLVYDDQAAPIRPELGKQALIDSNNGKIGAQFSVINPLTPSDPRSPGKLNRHIYEVERHETGPQGETLIHCKHVGPADP